MPQRKTPGLRIALMASALLAAAALVHGDEKSQEASSTGGSSIPRLPDGRPDLNGTWDNGSGIDFVKPKTLPDGSICVRGCEDDGPSGITLPPDRPKYRPEFVAKVKELEERQVELDPVLRCKPPGVPRIGPPDKIVQIPGLVVFLYDDVSGSFWRIIPTDGRPHRDDVEETYLGDSIGYWEGDTLVVVAQNFNEDTWLTDDGAFHTRNLRVTERLTRIGDTIEYRAIVEDPEVLAEPWHLRPRILKLTTEELVEPPPCVERDLRHVVDGSHHDNPR
ncbi:MAG: hypothetical protein DIU56_001895 [Pseudomonadota bacterium]|nr:MAG: hypothetical protein DIU56_06785 [Pseudomonadota bacterium]